MPRWAKKITIAVSAIVLLSVLVFLFRLPIAMGLVGLYVDYRIKVGPTQEVNWKTGADPAARSASERPPNIVLILADDLGWNDLTFNGGGVAGGTVPTPNIDSIAADGAAFMNGYAANATCAPSRAALMSGRYGTRFGFEFTPTPPGMMQIANLRPDDPDRLYQGILHPSAESMAFEDMGMPSSEITIAELLKTRGYHTAHIGKWHLGLTNGMSANNQGFDESLLMASGLYLPEDADGVVNAKQEFDFIDRFFWVVMRYAVRFNGGKPFEPVGYLTDYFTDQAVQVINNNKDRPFFLYLAHWALHSPLQATQEDYDALPDIGLHRERVYAGMIRNLDRGVGRVLQALEDNGIDDNTLVIFTSDNGGAGYIGLPDINKPFRGWKISLFEGGIHVPYFIKWPEKISPRTVINDPVHHFDIYATAAAAAGAVMPDDRKIDGVDLLPHIRGEATGVPHQSLFWRSGASQSALVDGWKLNISDPPGKVWLYDLAIDPTEQRNLAETHPDKLAEIRLALAAHNAQQIPPAWPALGDMPVNIDRDLSQPDQPGDDVIYWSN